MRQPETATDWPQWEVDLPIGYYGSWSTHRNLTTGIVYIRLDTWGFAGECAHASADLVRPR